MWSVSLEITCHPIQVEMRPKLETGASFLLYHVVIHQTMKYASSCLQFPSADSVMVVASSVIFHTQSSVPSCRRWTIWHTQIVIVKRKEIQSSIHVHIIIRSADGKRFIEITFNVKGDARDRKNMRNIFKAAVSQSILGKINPHSNTLNENWKWFTVQECKRKLKRRVN